MIPFDAYTVKARLAPAFLALLPLALVSYAWLPSFDQPWLMLILAPCGIGALVILALETRRSGQAIQAELFRAWGGSPTTILLRHSDPTVPAIDKARYHGTLAQCAGVTIPTPSDEAHDPGSADVKYETAVNWLRAQTRDSKRFPLVADENATYGFYRNLRGIRFFGFLASGVAAVGAAVLLLLAWANGVGTDWKAIAALVVSIMCLAIFVFAGSANRVREAAHDYAVALLGSIDGLTTKP